MSEKKTVYETLSTLDFKQHVKVLSGNKYIPWSDAWYEVKEAYPKAWYEVLEDDIGNPFFVSPMGIFVKVKVYIEEEMQTLNYPVLNGANKALKAESYSYKVKKYEGVYPNAIFNGKYEDKYVDPATTFDINTAIMRGLTKCIALMGGALYVYRDEDSPDVEKINSSQMQEITDLCKKHSFKISTIADDFGNYGKIANIPSAKFDDFIMWATPKAS